MLQPLNKIKKKNKAKNRQQRLAIKSKRNKRNQINKRIKKNNNSNRQRKSCLWEKELIKFLNSFKINSMLIYRQFKQTKMNFFINFKVVFLMNN